MINIFEVFLPQLLRYPNPTDPLNGEAAALLMREPQAYENKVKGNTSIIDLNDWCLVPLYYCLLFIIKFITPYFIYDLFFISEYVSRFATKEAADAANESSSEDEVSSVDSYSDEEEVPEMEL